MRRHGDDSGRGPSSSVPIPRRPPGRMEILGCALGMLILLAILIIFVFFLLSLPARIDRMGQSA